MKDKYSYWSVPIGGAIGLYLYGMSKTTVIAMGLSMLVIGAAIFLTNKFFEDTIKSKE